MKWLLPPLLALTLAACSSAPKKPSLPPAADAGKRPSPTQPQAQVASADCKGYAAAQEDPSTRGNYTAGGLYAPHVADTTPDYVPNVDCIAEPRITNESPSPVGNRSPYSVLGKQYKVMQRVDGYVEQGTASYYGNKFHGRLTSNREVYDMYAFTAAHKTLPLPSFARVTNLANGKSVVVRVNDRGPFHEGRVIDLSYAAAVKLGITQRGTGRVEVRALTPKDNDSRFASSRSPAKPATPVKATAMDQLVGKLPQQAAANVPVAVANASAAAVAATPLVDPRYPNRYRVVADLSKPPSADRFDSWLAARNLKVVGDRIVPAGAPAAAAATATATPAKSSTRAVATAGPASLPARKPAASSSRANDVWLQVASYSSRENADRALAQLNAAGIDGASLSDIQSNGRTFWRLRVGAPDHASASELAGRIAGLGLGRPQVISK